MECRTGLPAPAYRRHSAAMDFLLNGRCVTEADAHVSVSDRGFLYGDAAFDTLCDTAGGYSVRNNICTACGGRSLRCGSNRPARSPSWKTICIGCSSATLCAMRSCASRSRADPVHADQHPRCVVSELISSPAIPVPL